MEKIIKEMKISNEAQLDTTAVPTSREPEAQIVTIQHTHGMCDVEGENKFKTYYSRGIPPLLHTNHSSRKIALKSYKLLFGAVNDKPKYFDTTIDTLFLTNCRAGWEDTRTGVLEDLRLVRNLGMSYGPDYLFPRDVYWLYWFRSLQHVFLHVSVAQDADPHIRMFIEGTVHYFFYHDCMKRQRLSEKDVGSAPKVAFLDRDEMHCAASVDGDDVEWYF